MPITDWDDNTGQPEIIRPAAQNFSDRGGGDRSRSRRPTGTSRRTALSR